MSTNEPWLPPINRQFLLPVPLTRCSMHEIPSLSTADDEENGFMDQIIDAFFLDAFFRRHVPSSASELPIVKGACQRRSVP
mmetsp:Transcript_32633/g.70658  ORF Transcript_32633/g.70658 Transcript_32633/m.70658 type:complete len:81 (-) Transcript_32633:1256-1498(-)